MMKVTFLGHSGFLTETDDMYLLFDYYKGELPEMDPDKKMCVFVSHAHYDHYGKEIFRLREKFGEIRYILSSDISAPQEEDILSVRPNENVETLGLQIRTLRSNDEGVAFLVKDKDRTIYHAGDLNWWHWDGEDKAWNNNMAANYKREVDKLEGQRFDAAFVPLDPRLGDAFYWGMKYFLEQTHAEAVFPMHCWEDYSVCKKVRKLEEMKGLTAPLRDVEYPGQEWNLC